jgi:hypothetical protein
MERTYPGHEPRVQKPKRPKPSAGVTAALRQKVKTMSFESEVKLVFKDTGTFLENAEAEFVRLF